MLNWSICKVELVYIYQSLTLLKLKLHNFIDHDDSRSWSTELHKLLYQHQRNPKINHSENVIGAELNHPNLVLSGAKQLQVPHLVVDQTDENHEDARAAAYTSNRWQRMEKWTKVLLLLLRCPPAALDYSLGAYPPLFLCVFLVDFVIFQV